MKTSEIITNMRNKATLLSNEELLKALNNVQNDTQGDLETLLHVNTVLESEVVSRGLEY